MRTTAGGAQLWRPFHNERGTRSGEALRPLPRVRSTLPTMGRSLRLVSGTTPRHSLQAAQRDRSAQENTLRGLSVADVPRDETIQDGRLLAILGPLPGSSWSGRRESNSRSQLGNEFPLIFGGFQRTSADELSSSGELSGQLRTPADDGECAKFGPSREVKVSVPSAVVGALENAAAVLGVSLEALVVRIITQGRGRVADEDSESTE